MQIMEGGNILGKHSRFHEYFGHYHTGGNPGRNEINKLRNYIPCAIHEGYLATGYKGHVGHKNFISTWAIKICKSIYIYVPFVTYNRMSIYEILKKILI